MFQGSAVTEKAAVCRVNHSGFRNAGFTWLLAVLGGSEGSALSQTLGCGIWTVL